MGGLQTSWKLFVALVIALGFAAPATPQSMRTDINLVIAIDCSYSVNSGEYALQVGGIAQALSDPLVMSAIQQGPRGGIAISIIQWSTAESQLVVLPWTRIANPGDAIRTANLVSRMPRQTAQGGTSIVGALRQGQALLENAPFSADRLIIDVIADGENNNGGRVEATRDALIRRGTIINALAVHNEVSYLHYYLKNRVIGGPGAFVEKAADYQDFSRTFLRKLLREIKGEHFS